MIKLTQHNRPIYIALFFIIAIILTGTAYTLWTQGTAPMLSPPYLLQQLQVGSFLGICAAGMMMVILLGHIDLSIPWTLTASAMVATAVGGPWAIPAGLSVGLVVGLINGLGVTYLNIPSMIFTLGIDSVLRGLMVAQTGGFAPQTEATPLMRYLAADQLLGIPTVIFVWAAVSICISLILKHTAFGKAIYATGAKERATYLSGIKTKKVVIGAFVISSLCAATAGILLAGYSAKAYQGMGLAFLLPSIAAVVIGGTHILGGRGRYLGTLVGVVLIVFLNSVLSIMQMPEAFRQIIYGLVIITMLVIYGREDQTSS